MERSALSASSTAPATASATAGTGDAESFSSAPGTAKGSDSTLEVEREDTFDSVESEIPKAGSEGGDLGVKYDGLDTLCTSPSSW